MANGVWPMAHKFGEFQLKSLANLAALNIGEIEWRIFRQTLCAGNFFARRKSLVKLTLGAHLSLISQKSRFSPLSLFSEM
jgi:hypothetical protein